MSITTAKTKFADVPEDALTDALYEHHKIAWLDRNGYGLDEVVEHMAPWLAEAVVEAHVSGADVIDAVNLGLVTWETDCRKVGHELWEERDAWVPDVDELALKEVPEDAIEHSYPSFGERFRNRIAPHMSARRSGGTQPRHSFNRIVEHDTDELFELFYEPERYEPTMKPVAAVKAKEGNQASGKPARRGAHFANNVKTRIVEATVYESVTYEVPSPSNESDLDKTAVLVRFEPGARATGSKRRGKHFAPAKTGEVA